MAFSLQMLRTLIQAHPDRAARLELHVTALEVAIEKEPDRCLERVRALFEATHSTIAPQLGVTFRARDEFQARNSLIFNALDLKLTDHPDAIKIDKVLKKLVGSINGSISALAELSNIPGMRHGGSLDWSTLERQHAYMLGGLCDTLVSFLFSAAWSRNSLDSEQASTEPYDDTDRFNALLDESYGDIRIAGAIFLPSKILHSLDPIQYEAARSDWEAEQLMGADDSEFNT